MTDEQMTCTIYELHKNNPHTGTMRGGWIESSKWHISFGRAGVYEVTSDKLLKLLQHDEVKTLYDRLTLEHPNSSLGDLYHDGVINMGQLVGLMDYLVPFHIENITKEEEE